MPLACIIRARTHDQKNDCFFDLEMINNDYNYARGGFPLETVISPLCMLVPPGRRGHVALQVHYSAHLNRGALRGGVCCVLRYACM